MKTKLIRLLAVMCSAIIMAFAVTPVKAEEVPGGPYGDISGWYSWRINGKGWTIYSQNNVSWIYDQYGNRIYLDAYDNQLYGVSYAAAQTITANSLTYYKTENNTTVYTNPNGQLYTVDNNGYMYYYGSGSSVTPSPSVGNYTMYYWYTTPNGTNIYGDDYGNAWWFSAGGIPNRYYGTSDGSYWRTDVSNYTYKYQYRSSDGYYIYRDDYGNYWWFGSDGTPHQYGGSSSGSSSSSSSKPAETNVDYSRVNYMEADGVKTAAYVGQYWQVPTSISWAPTGMRLVGWDYAENTGYVRWAPGTWVKNTGSDLYLYPVFR